MNSCNCNNNCSVGCKPAQLRCDFDIQVSPYDPSQWFVTICGASKKIKAPKIPNIDTALSIDTSKGVLKYDAEYHTDVVTGDQLGDIINLDSLHNVDIDPTLEGHCFELVYRKWAQCGKGCISAADRWENFNIYTEGAKKDGIEYVRGANEFGCPVFLDKPSDVSEYWWGMWHPRKGNFTYVQPEEVSKLPTDSNGNVRVLSQDSEGKPIVGPMVANLTIGAKEFMCRKADPSVRDEYYVPNSVSTQEFLVVPDDEPDWRAPCAGVLWVGYCVNPSPQAPGYGEIDVTIMLSDETWSKDKEIFMSSHSTWTWVADTEWASESCSGMRVLKKGQTIKLHARCDAGDMPSRNGQWRIHAVRSVFIPLELGR